MRILDYILLGMIIALFWIALEQGQAIKELQQRPNHEQRIADLTAASKAAWYELDVLREKVKPEKMVDSIFNHLREVEK